MLVRTATRFSPNGHRRGSRAAEKTEGAATASSADTDAGDEDSDKRRTSGVRWRKVRPPSGHLSSPERPNSAESAIPVPHTGSGGRTAPEAGRTAGPETKTPNEVGSRTGRPVRKKPAAAKNHPLVRRFGKMCAALQPEKKEIAGADRTFRRNDEQPGKNGSFRTPGPMESRLSRRHPRSAAHFQGNRPAASEGTRSGPSGTPKCRK